MNCALVWFRRDLRIEDNPALLAAAARHATVLPIYIHAPQEEVPWQAGGAQRVWLHASLQALAESLAKRGLPLLLRSGQSLTTLLELIAQTGAMAVYWNRLYEPATIARDREIKECLHRQGLDVQSFNAALWQEPWNLSTREGKPYRVFTAFWRTLAPLEPAAPQPAPRRLCAPAQLPPTLALEELKLRPRLPWGKAVVCGWTPGEAGATEALQSFFRRHLKDYAQARDFPAQTATSRLSAHLHFGEIGPRQIWHAIKAQSEFAPEPAAAFLREIAWREFAHHLLYHYAQTPDEPLDRRYAQHPWTSNPAALSAWQRGHTGIPIIDAGMRELWQTGTLHNRVRMLVASLLVKNLGIHWHQGARWFWDTLFDADLANNTLGWQWVAGCGADAAPYYRIFNPVLQGERFDAEGIYVRRYVPELQRLPNRWIHRPWEAPAAVLEAAGLRLGTHYPHPLIDLATSRAQALAHYQDLKSQHRSAQ